MATLEGVTASVREFLGSVDLVDWVAWFDAPVDMNLASGEFVVDASEHPELKATGLFDDEELGLPTTMHANAYGEIDLSEGTWFMDYSETSGGDSIELHLSGTVDAPPFP